MILMLILNEEEKLVSDENGRNFGRQDCKKLKMKTQIIVTYVPWEICHLKIAEKENVIPWTQMGRCCLIMEM